LLLCAFGIWRFAAGLPEEWRVYSLLVFVSVGDILIEWPHFKRDCSRPISDAFGGPSAPWYVRGALLVAFAVSQFVLLALVAPPLFPGLFPNLGATYYVPLLIWLFGAAIVQRAVGYRSRRRRQS
jgi:hypothetical protein